MPNHFTATIDMETPSTVDEQTMRRAIERLASEANGWPKIRKVVVTQTQPERLV